MASCVRLGRALFGSKFHSCKKVSLQTTSRYFGKCVKSEFLLKKSVSRKLLTASLVALTSSYLFYKKYHGSMSWFLGMSNCVHAKEVQEEPQERQPSFRELRFNNFASVEYQGHTFMTPRDFLESITYDNPRYRTGRLKLNKAGVEKLLKTTPSRRKSSSSMFRSLGENGLISYTEYLFLLCVLTKPKSGFKIAFNMFDVDGDERVDKKEFLVLEQLLAHTEKFGSDPTNELIKDTRRKLNLWDILQESVDGVVFGMKKLSSKGKNKAGCDCYCRKKPHGNIWQLMNHDMKNLLPGYYMEPITDTTLTIHFFGTKGRDYMNYEDFHRFMDNLQTEVLELEFAEFSCGLPTISEIEFAQILLRYTKLTKEENDRYLNRLRSRIEHSKGITFKDFKEFCQFLNSIEDFSMAMRIYTYADHPISEADFTRAVKACTGQTLNSHVIHVVFQLFDIDGDGRLSHREFISVMKERIHRGAKHARNTRWDSFKGCVKSELRSSS